MSTTTQSGELPPKEKDRDRDRDRGRQKDRKHHHHHHHHHSGSVDKERYTPDRADRGESTVVTDSPEETETTTGIESTTVAGHGHPARAESA